jgi:hypothetical protein
VLDGRADVFPDPAKRNTVYIYSYNGADQGSSTTAQLQRSDDAGEHWSVVRTPADAGVFRPVLDPHEPGLLELRPSGGRGAADRIYLSRDRGRSWRAATCPGDWHRECPAFVLDNVFGRGHAYAFVGNGIYTFNGAGPARARLAISDRLPFKIPQLLDVEGGSHAGDPIYVLGKSAADQHARLYRSTDGGHRWRQLS